ncbi:CRISPR-associated protein Cas4 [Desulfosporosinus sp. BICA1-9]|uniref:CRISPR-associated protein Cas4 n=1 Tax=Desulfosporosinus sp. BICA1-9 TaxID=1531958 RepID=UPI00054C5DED|nr:CRISPR-associated protein Cas4 [Desulfosporosinus sp. BICA1-9]KJS49054.1 MAG: CRISPR-associated protein Cas4 [Peptococcaceae bacterium BRH_c23]KJS89789.1 MAG: CRISPR-associated protein Cas4 [Desulfosporosinus sp. BICA1-9]
MEYQEEDFLLLSGIQHYVFCKRQWALIHIEQQWQENLRTVEGAILHEKTHDSTIKEKRGALIISRGMGVFSRTLGITGACDVVEFHKSRDGVTLYGREGTYLPVPVEYKRGKPKQDNADVLQLCAQAMCLEEMLLCTIRSGFLYYGEPKRRTKVALDVENREEVIRICREMHELYDKRYTPKVRTTKACKACSLKELCLPKLCKNPSALDYMRKTISEIEVDP